MKKIKEKELKQAIQCFENKAVIIKYAGLVNSITYIRKLSIKFDDKTGILYMRDFMNKNSFKVNIAPAYNMKIKEDNTELIIELDNSIDIKIKIKK